MAAEIVSRRGRTEPQWRGGTGLEKRSSGGVAGRQDARASRAPAAAGEKKEQKKQGPRRNKMWVGSRRIATVSGPAHMRSYTYVSQLVPADADADAARATLLPVRRGRRATVSSCLLSSSRGLRTLAQGLKRSRSTGRLDSPVTSPAYGVRTYGDPSPPGEGPAGFLPSFVQETSSRLASFCRGRGTGEGRQKQPEAG